jgi:hypothetical protein
MACGEEAPGVEDASPPSPCFVESVPARQIAPQDLESLSKKMVIYFGVFFTQKNVPSAFLFADLGHSISRTCGQP